MYIYYTPNTPYYTLYYTLTNQLFSSPLLQVYHSSKSYTSKCNGRGLHAPSRRSRLARIRINPSVYSIMCIIL